MVWAFLVAKPRTGSAPIAFACEVADFGRALRSQALTATFGGWVRRATAGEHKKSGASNDAPPLIVAAVFTTTDRSGRLQVFPNCLLDALADVGIDVAPVLERTL